jgi:hypothetical protein
VDGPGDICVGIWLLRGSNLKLQWPVNEAVLVYTRASSSAVRVKEQEPVVLTGFELCDKIDVCYIYVSARPRLQRAMQAMGVSAAGGVLEANQASSQAHIVSSTRVVGLLRSDQSRGSEVGDVSSLRRSWRSNVGMHSID